jgi:hypothetical protein
VPVDKFLQRVGIVAKIADLGLLQKGNGAKDNDGCRGKPMKFNVAGGKQHGSLPIVFSLLESLADIRSQINTAAVLQVTVGWRPSVKNLSLSATGNVQGVAFSDYPGGRQDLVLVGSGNRSWTPHANLSIGAGVKFTQ